MTQKRLTFCFFLPWDRVWWPLRYAHLWMWSKRGLWQPAHLIARCPPLPSCQVCIGMKAWLPFLKDGHQHSSAWPHKPLSPLSYWNSSRNGMLLGMIGNFWWQRFRLLLIILPSYRHTHTHTVSLTTLIKHIHHLINDLFCGPIYILYVILNAG